MDAFFSFIDISYSHWDGTDKFCLSSLYLHNCLTNFSVVHRYPLSCFKCFFYGCAFFVSHQLPCSLCMHLYKNATVAARLKGYLLTLSECFVKRGMRTFWSLSLDVSARCVQTVRIWCSCSFFCHMMTFLPLNSHMMRVRKDLSQIQSYFLVNLVIMNAHIMTSYNKL